jgi:hypothetical protein
MSEEVLGAIKFQHQNLLHLVDYLRERVGTLTSVVTEARAELEARKHDDKYPPQPLPKHPHLPLPQTDFNSLRETPLLLRVLMVDNWRFIGNELRSWRDWWM